MSRHLLLVANAFPPSAEAGARRALRFANGLQREGFRVTVLTLESPYYPQVDASLVARAQGEFRVVRTVTWSPIARLRARRERGADPAAAPPAEGGGTRPRAQQLVSAALRRVLRPDPEILWAPPALRAMGELHALDPVDLVLATLPPWSSLLSAARFARRARVPLVVDYRDPWASGRLPGHDGGRLQRMEARVEQRCLRHASLLVFNAPSARDLYRRYQPELARSEVLYNGIDAYVPRRAELPRAPLTWAHAGSLYSGQRSLAAVVRAMAKHRERIDLRLLLIGAEPVAELRLAESLGVRSRIEWTGRLPFDETLERLRLAHRLVAPIAPVHLYSIPGKIFDYMSLSRPMLLLADARHAAREVVARFPQHRALEPDDAEGVAALALEDHAALKAGGLVDVDRELSRPFEASEQVRELAGWLAELGA